MKTKKRNKNNKECVLRKYNYLLNQLIMVSLLNKTKFKTN